MSNDLSDFAPEYLASLVAQGFTSLRACGPARVCGVARFNFTWGLVVDIDLLGHSRRYCYEHEEDANAALTDWDGRDHPGGPWIKCRGAAIEMLNPTFGREPSADHI